MAWLFVVELYDPLLIGPPIVGPDSYRVIDDAKRRAEALRSENKGRAGLRVRVTERDEWGRTVQVVSDEPVLDKTLAASLGRSK